MTTVTSQTMERFLSKLSHSPRLRRIMPAEWVGAADILEEMAELDTKRPRETRNSRVFTFAQFLLGMMPGSYLAFLMAKLDASIPGMFIAAILAMSAILTGFVVTLMLFAGTVGKPELLPLEKLKSHISRLKYLLSSQTTTLMASVLMAVASVAWMALYILKVDGIYQGMVGGVCLGLLVISLIRSVLLPFQIFELHNAVFFDLLKAAAERTREYRE
ncbi:hypothetical protein [Lysobacter sp. yr284]|uniref:hypothetical protein n=1 Tax=Lysobacter sp. yr284 TaxID=1761791 RepID=UPI0011133C7F|nr:hypothetical protein [Lysobacter sp. yr284]